MSPRIRTLHRRMDAARNRFRTGDFTEWKVAKMQDITRRWFEWRDRQEIS